MPNGKGPHKSEGMRPMQDIQDEIRAELDARMSDGALERSVRRQAARSRRAHTVERNRDGSFSNIINE